MNHNLPPNIPNQTTPCKSTEDADVHDIG